MQDQNDTAAVIRDCEIGTTILSKMFSALTAVTYSEKGADALHELWFLFLTTHQGEKYAQGLLKLGIVNDTPAVSAAKYHYFTNIIGGLKMEYVEENPKKVWIRYVSPMWMYGGVALMAMPSNLRRFVFSSWHPRNGQYMGCPRLGYVGTKFTSEGDPCDEGYFYEYDHDLSPSQIMRFEVAHRTPEFDPEKAPKLDAELWPEIRLMKARRNFSSGYLRVTIEVLQRMYGDLVTQFLVSRAMRLMATQFTPEFMKLTGVEGTGAEAAALFFSRSLRAMAREHQMEKVDDRTWRIRVDNFRPFDELSEDMRRSFFEYQKMAGRMISGRLRVERQRIDEQAEIWEITDTGRWQW